MSKIICPQCFSDDLWRFGKEPKTNLQRYRCKHCFRQFTNKTLRLEPKHKPYPKYPICGRATYLHHEYLYYSNYTCGNKKCRHSIKVVKQSAIDS